MNSERAGNVYADLLTKLMELDSEEMMMVAAALKSSADTAYLIKNMNDERLKNMPTGGLQ